MLLLGFGGKRSKSLFEGVGILFIQNAVDAALENATEFRVILLEHHADTAFISDGIAGVVHAILHNITACHRDIHGDLRTPTIWLQAVSKGSEPAVIQPFTRSGGLPVPELISMRHEPYWKADVIGIKLLFAYWLNQGANVGNKRQFLLIEQLLYFRHGWV